MKVIKADLKPLIEMYKTSSPSGKEAPMRQLVTQRLGAMGIAYKIDPHGQVYSLAYPKAPLMAAHMDQVRCCDHATKVKVSKRRIWGNGNLGADDKNGCWIILETLKSHAAINFIFTTEEESGGLPFEDFLFQHSTELANIPYGLIFDRRNGGDIIGMMNGYCDDDLEKAVHNIGKPYGYKPTSGVWSDCDALCRFVPCVNLSCGYYEAHTTNEYTSIRSLRKALALADALIGGLSRDRFDLASVSYAEFEWDRPYLDTDYDYCEQCFELGELATREIFGKEFELCPTCAGYWDEEGE